MSIGVEIWAIRWALGCVNPASWLPLAAAGRKLTQPRALLVANICTYDGDLQCMRRHRTP